MEKGVSTYKTDLDPVVCLFVCCYLFVCLLLECTMETDMVYGLNWGFTSASQTSTQPCGMNFIGEDIPPLSSSLSNNIPVITSQ